MQEMNVNEPIAAMDGPVTLEVETIVIEVNPYDFLEESMESVPEDDIPCSDVSNTQEEIETTIPSSAKESPEVVLNKAALKLFKSRKITPDVLSIEPNVNLIAAPSSVESVNQAKFVANQTREMGSGVKEAVLPKNVDHIKSPFNQGILACPTCNTMFKQQVGFMQHLLQHIEEGPFSCQYCDKPFASKDNLLAHLQCHMDKILFECCLCGEQVNGRSNYIKHVKGHSKTVVDEDQKPYPCRLCKKSFLEQDDLMRHALSHGVVKSNVRGVRNSSYSEMGDPSARFVKHAGEKPFVCTSCQKAFLKKDYLAAHLKRKTCKIVPNRGNSEQAVDEVMQQE